eukprot:12415678-Karenia_brevis.AAC.1
MEKGKRKWRRGGSVSSGPVDLANTPKPPPPPKTVTPPKPPPPPPSPRALWQDFMNHSTDSWADAMYLPQ